MEEQVYNYLIMNHIGKDNLIKNIDLRKRFNIGSDKSMRKIIIALREKWLLEIRALLSRKMACSIICLCIQSFKT